MISYAFLWKKWSVHCTKYNQIAVVLVQIFFLTIIQQGDARDGNRMELQEPQFKLSGLISSKILIKGTKEV